MKIDKTSRVPLYAQLIEIVAKKIESGAFKEGEQLPTEREFCEMYGVSRITVRQAMGELVSDGYINKLHGKGIFVSPKIHKQQLAKVYSFTEEMQKQGKKQHTEILLFETCMPTRKVAEKLEIDEEVFKLVRRRSVDNEFILIETTYLPKSKFPELKREDLENSGLYDVILRKYNFKVDRALEIINAVEMNGKDAARLNEKSGTAALKIVRLAYHNNIPCEYTVSIVRGSKYAYTVELDDF